MVSRRAFLALSSAALFLGAQFGTYAHLAFEAHAICPEHGEVVHAEHAETAAPDFEGPSLLAEGEHEHDECLIAIAPRTPALANAAQAEVQPPKPSIERPTLIVASGEHQAFARLYLQAPKQSPPA